MMYQDDWRAEYEALRRERDRLFAEVERRGLLDAYIALEVENEGWDGEETYQVAALKRLLAKGAPRPSGFAARFTGTCARGRDRIVVGQYIERAKPRGYQHTECPT